MPNFNAFMHRRNIFRKEPDFKKLACDYQELKQYMTVGSKNRLKFDFKNPDALRALTCALLHRYFQKRIHLPADRMVPAVPQRLNYICWIEDLVKLLENQVSHITGIDIGSGASCIFPILSCHRNPSWCFVGVEADAMSYTVALENVQKNYMEDQIRMIKISTEHTLNDIVCLSPHPVTFVMCNPPFFEEEYGVSLESNPNICNSGSRPKSTSNTSAKIESSVNGGEISFVGHMLEQSRNLKEEVTIYTSMLGRKQSLIHFKQTLSSLNEDNLSWTWAELCQGKTIRYAIAWSFKPGLDLTKAPLLRHGKNKSWKFKLARKMPKRDCQLELLENGEFLKNLIARELLIAKMRVTRQNAQTIEILIKTSDRTWSNQRRKRREQLNKHKHPATSASNALNSLKNVTLLNNELSNLQEPSAKMVCDSLVADSTGGDSKPSSNSTDQHHHHHHQFSGSSSHHSDTFGANLHSATAMHTDSPSYSNHNSNHHNHHQSQPEPTTNTTTHPMPAASSTAPPPVHTSESIQTNLNNLSISKKRKNPSSCSSSPSRICPSPNDELTDDDNQSTDNSSDSDDQQDDSTCDMMETKRICIKDPCDNENMDDIYDYLLCCRISLSRVCHDLYFELKLEHPCAAASDAYDLFQYFRNKLTEK